MIIRLLCPLLVASALCVSLFATSVKPPTFPELVNGADYVVHARVKSVTCEARAMIGGRPRIYTQVSLEVIETVAGTPPAEVVLTCLGGVVGDMELRVEGAPEFKVGDEDFLFVSGNGRVFFPLYGLTHGRYPVRHDAQGRAYIARANEVPLTDVAEVSAPLTSGASAALQQRLADKSAALTPEKFATQIREVRHGR